jgi:RNA polymerase sigma-70 factor (ECF subfamily)
MSRDEAELIRQAKRGDAAAFSEIYRRCHPAIYRYIVLRVGSAAVAEDLSSEVFVRLVDKIDRFQYRGRPLLAWLFTIARNLVADHHRRAGRYTSVELDEQTAAPGTGPETRAEQRLAELGLVAAVAKLPDAQRQVILLKFAQGMDNASVAAIMGRSVGAVKELQRRALAKLRGALLEEEQESWVGNGKR